MRITGKFTIALTCAILTVLAVNSIIRVKREIGLFEADIPNDNTLLGRAVAGAIARVWQRVGEAEALDLVQDANERESHVVIRWVWLDAPIGDQHAPSVPMTALARLSDGPVSLRSRPPDEAEDFMYTFVVITQPGPRRIAVELRASLADQRRYLRTTIVQATIATGALVTICALLALFMGVVFIGRPVRKLVEHAHRIGDGDLSSRLEMRQHDEIGELGAEMNALSDRLSAARQTIESEAAAKVAAEDQLRHADRLASVGKLAAGVAHEVGTPLNVITGHAQLITDEYPADSAAHVNAVVIDEQAHRVVAIIRQLLDFARQRTPQRTSHDLANIAGQVVAMLDGTARKRGVTLELDVARSGARSRVDTAQFQQVIMNLVVNAIQASRTGGTVAIGASLRWVTPPADHGGSPAEYTCVYVRDHGTGIPAELVPRIFEPFFTTKDVGDGTGLGLSVAYGIAKEHGGWIGVESELGIGTCFTVYLPAETPT